MNVTFPTLTKELNVSLGTVQWLTTGYLLLTTIVMSTTAYVLKKFNPLKIFIFAATLCLVGSLICFMAPNFPVLMAGRLLQAVATGLSTPLMFNLIFEEIPPTKLGLYTGLAGVVIFARYNKKSQRQLIDFSILKLPVLRLRLFGYFSLQFINIGLSFVLPIFAQTALKLDSAQAGLMLLPGSLMGAIVGPIAGHLYDKKGATFPLMISGILLTSGSLLFWFQSEKLTLLSITLIYIVVRLGFNFGFGPSLSDGSMQVQGRKKSDQNSLFSMMQQYAGSLGTNVLSVVISAVALTSGTKNEVLNTVLGTKIDFILLTVLSLCVLVSVIYVYYRYEKEN